MNQTTPLVSIGVPVYNGGAELRRALETLLAQTHTNLEIIVSDNASTDETEAICRAFAARDPRVIYHRNETNLGPGANFEKVLQMATGEFFMWAAHDDWWAPRFVEVNTQILFSHLDIVASVSQVGLIPADPSGERAGGTFPLMGSVERNVVCYLNYPAMNSRFYGVFRREPLLACYRDLPSVWGADWLLIVRILKYGKFYEVGECLFTRRHNYIRSETIDRVYSRITQTHLERLFPLAEFTRLILAEPHVPKTPAVLLALAKHNLMHCTMSLKTLLHRKLLGARN